MNITFWEMSTSSKRPNAFYKFKSRIGGNKSVQFVLIKQRLGSRFLGRCAALVYRVSQRFPDHERVP